MHTADLKALLPAREERLWCEDRMADPEYVWTDSETQTITARQHIQADPVRRARKPAGDRMRVRE